MKKMHILSNSHLDREHRHEFQETRLMMVKMLDDVIEIMEQDENYKFFTLDGQAIVLDDYLEMRPMMKERLEALINAGRIQIGPWYSLVDCYSVDPESIVRNLLVGKRVCDNYQGAMPVGYSIFSFGQMAQLPQIYAGFGIHDIVFYKGASTAVFPNSEFIWRAPDGTEAFTTRLGREKRWNFFFDFDIPVILGGNAKMPGWQSRFTDEVKLFHFADDNFKGEYATELNPEIRIREEKIDQAIDTVVSLLDETLSEHVLAGFDGTDFTSPLKEIPEAIRLVNEHKKGELELVHSNPVAYFEELKKDIDPDKLIHYEGEMRFGPVNHIHSETMGTNTDIKQGIWYAENKIIHILEPLTGMLKSMGVQSDKDAMDLMWKYLLATHAHDSIHGSGDPKIKTDNLNRLDQVSALANSLIRRAGEALCRQIKFTDQDAIRIVVMNTTPYRRSEIVKLTLDFPKEERVEDFTILDENGKQIDYYPLSEREFNLASINRHNRPKSVYSDRREVLLQVDDIPATGYKTLKVIRKKGSMQTSTNPFPIGVFPYAPIAKSGNVLDNGKIRVTLNNGSIEVFDYETGLCAKELNAFTSIGSSGDFWVHREPFYNTHVSSKQGRTKIELMENSSLRATYRMTCYMEIPVGLNEARTKRLEQTNTVAVSTDITVHKDSKRIDFITRMDNTCKDQLFTVSFPTGIIAEEAEWEAPFELRKRKVDHFTNNRLKKGAELERQALQGFVNVVDSNQGMALFTKGIREAGTVSDHQTVINLTLFRGCSNTFPIHNDLLIGFENETSQCLGKQRFEYSILLHDGKASVLPECRKYQTDVLAAQVGYGDGGDAPEKYSLFCLSNQNTAVSTVKLSEDQSAVIIRLYNPTGQDINEEMRFSVPLQSASICEMNEENDSEAEVCDQVLKVVLKPYQIVTVKVIFA